MADRTVGLMLLPSRSGLPLAARGGSAAGPAVGDHRRQRHRQVVAVSSTAAAGGLRPRRGDRVAGPRGRPAIGAVGRPRAAGRRATLRKDRGHRAHPARILELGFAADDFGYLVDLGLPQSAGKSVFARDPEIKREVLFAGPVLRPSTTLVRRSRGFAEASADSGSGFDELSRSLPSYHSVLAEYAHPHALPELAAVRERLRGWRFYDGFRVDAGAPARHPQVGTRTPVLADDGSDLAAAIKPSSSRGSTTSTGPSPRRSTAPPSRWPSTTVCSTFSCASAACCAPCGRPNYPTAHCVSCCGPPRC